MASPPSPSANSQAPQKEGLFQLNRYQWFVFSMAALAWLFDCLDQQLFILARNDAMKDLLKGQPPEVLKAYGGYATSIFVMGWATGGLIFGALGDRIGRAKTLTITVLMYSLCTGLSAFSTGWTDFAIYRFITGLGVGGVFGLAVALIADTLPSSSRPMALALLQALSAVGNVSAGLISILLAYLGSQGTINPEKSWVYMFLIGAIPAFLCVFIQVQLREPEKWVEAKKASKITGEKFGSYAALFGDPRWRTNALLGMLLCVSGVVGLWGIGFFTPELVGGVIEASLKEKGLSKEEIQTGKTFWIGINMIVLNTGAFLGMLGFGRLAQAIGRKPAFLLAFAMALVATYGYFRYFNGVSDLWMSAVLGFFQLSLFAGFAVYLPELFPLRLRSTGTSFCYNVGRFIAASGPFTLGALQQFLAQGAKDPDPAIEALRKLDAFRDACCWMSLIFILGFVVVLFMPETKGKPLPE